MQPFSAFCITVIEEGRVGETNRIEASISWAITMGKEGDGL